MNRLKIIVVLLLFIPILSCSQKYRLTFKEAGQIEREMWVVDQKIADNMLDSLRQRINEKIELDLMNDSLYFTSLIHERNIDSLTIDTLDLEFIIVTKRGGKMVLAEEGNFPINIDIERRIGIRGIMEILEWQEIHNYMGKYERFPCDLVESISTHIRLRGTYDILYLRYQFDCEAPKQVRITNREISIEKREMNNE